MFEAHLSGSTVKILDKYIESKEQYFKILDNFKIVHNDIVYDVNFVISNKMIQETKIVKTNITMTEFKKIFDRTYVLKDMNKYMDNVSSLDRTNIPKINLPVYDFILSFYKHLQNNFDDKLLGDLIKFENPISINAQSSDNRTGYGNEYYYDTLIYEGTKYGETSEFPIVGYQICKAGEVHNNSIRWTTQDGYIHIQSM